MIGTLFGGLLDRIVLVAGTVAGGCVPSFVAQYRQRAGGRLDQVVQDLAPFQEIANRFHGGSLQELIRHHLASADLTFRAEGAAIQAMVDSEQRLRTMLDALQGSLWNQLVYLVPHHDAQLMHSTWTAFVPAFTLDLQGIVIALIVGTTAWLIFIILWRALCALWLAFSRRNWPTQHKERLSR